MIDVTNPADELLLALSHGPLPGGIQNWEILDSWIDGETAKARLLVDGKTFTVSIDEED
jgi:hypothetical protein